MIFPFIVVVGSMSYLYKGISEKLGWCGFRTPQMSSPFALQSIFSTWSIPPYPPYPLQAFIGNIAFPADFHAPTGKGEVEMKKSDPTVAGPIRS